MKKFEYYVCSIGNDQYMAKELDVLGKDGWELVSIIDTRFIFKKEIIENNTEEEERI